MSKHYIKLVNMTSTEVFKRQAANIFSRLRHNNTSTDNSVFFPTHMGGLPGQREIIESKSIMRETRITQ